MMDQRLMDADTIVFDVGNVLLGFDPDRVCAMLPESIREPLFQVMFGPRHLWGIFDLGAEDNRRLAREIAQDAGLHVPPAHVRPH